MEKFKLKTEFKPKGDQVEAIKLLTDWLLKKKNKFQTLLGVTGSGKTFTIANVINNINKPTLVLTHNKTLAAQLYEEFKSFFPENAVEYFVSYYDYYQPEAYLPQTDIYIEKDTSINETIDKLRHRATYSLLERNDVIIVASVSCIYGLGSPEAYSGMLLYIEKHTEIERDFVLKKLVEIQYERNEYDFHRGTFRVKGDIIEVFPAYEEEKAIRIVFFGDYIEEISEFDPLTGKTIQYKSKVAIYPGSHFVATENTLKYAIKNIRKELELRVKELQSQNKILEAQRLLQRTNYDLEFLEEMGYCKGIENYSRYLTNRKPGERPPTLLDYFPKDFLIVIDESHVTLPQVHGMYKGDRSRKETLVEYGFRLPSALDNRPLKFEEFEKIINQVIFVSATPAKYELEKSKRFVAEQIIRPTGLIDPEIIIKPAKHQIDDLVGEINKTVSKGYRVLITTLTKRMAENLTDYLRDLNIKTIYLHSEIDTLERIEIIRELRRGSYDVLVGINLLREGLDIPEVAFVAILDADKEGFLRSETSIIQTIGRAARNIEAKAILYADVITGSIERAVKETNRRRRKQLQYNKEHNITPETIKKKISDDMNVLYLTDYFTVPVNTKIGTTDVEEIPKSKLPKVIKELEKDMKKYAEKLEFEMAAEIRDKIVYLRSLL
jgi:excinuclease ABC subunit B